MKNTMKTAILVLVGAGACGSGDECEVTGVFDVAHQKTSGNCDESANVTLTVIQAGDLYQMTDGEGLLYQGIIDAAECRVDAATTISESGITLTGRYRLDLGDEVSGILTVSIDDNSGVPPDVSCDATYDVVGSRR